MKRIHLLATLALILTICLGAAITTPKDRTWTLLRDDVAANDTIANVTTATAPTSGTLTVGEKNNVMLGVNFSTAGASCKVHVFGWPVGGTGYKLSELTFTAETWKVATNGNYGCTAQSVDAIGCNVLYFYVTDLSAGTVDINGLAF